MSTGLIGRLMKCSRCA